MCPEESELHGCARHPVVSRPLNGGTAFEASGCEETLHGSTITVPFGLTANGGTGVDVKTSSAKSTEIGECNEW